jgi:hypothetical protein
MKRLVASALIGLLAWTSPLPGMGQEKKKEAGSVRVYRFDNLDIEGHVKTPHLMYFLKRIKNKFRSFRLPKQNFKKRILESKDADFLK